MFLCPFAEVPGKTPDCPSHCGSFLEALNSGHAECLRYWHSKPEHILESRGSYRPEEEGCCHQAAQSPSAEALMYMHDLTGLPWDAVTSKSAAQVGSIACLKYLHASGCPWDERTCSSAARGGSLECLVYARDHGCPWDVDTCANAARAGSLECLTYAHEHGCPWDHITCNRTAVARSVACLRYAHEQGCPWNQETIRLAALSNSLECLKYAHENGCPWDILTTVMTALEGNLECLAYAHEHGCPLDARTLFSAATHGKFDCLVYAHENGCPYNQSPSPEDGPMLTVAATYGRSMQCLVYVREVMGCAWDILAWESKTAFDLGQCDMLEYIHTHGGVWCPQIDLMCPNGTLEHWLSIKTEKDVGARAECLLYMHCIGGSELPAVWDTEVGKAMLGMLEARRAAVLLCFQASANAGGRAESQNAALAVMRSVPEDLIRQILCAAKLQSPASFSSLRRVMLTERGVL